MSMDAADRKADAIMDLLYTKGVRTTEHVGLSAYPTAARQEVMISVHRHHYDCEGCRSKSLGAKIMDGLKRGVRPACPGCRIHSEAMEFEQRALLKRIRSVLERDFTITDEYSGFTMASITVSA